MAPAATQSAPSVDEVPIQTKGGNAPTETSLAVQPDVEDELPQVLTGHREPIKSTGALDQFEHFEVTPVLGREYVNVNLVELLNAPNSDDLIRELALTISQRGVVFFRRQDDVTEAVQKQLVQRLGELSGKPSSSKLHIHPVHNSSRGDTKDDEISVISSARAKELRLRNFLSTNKKQSNKSEWHSDITFEPVPSDYTLLRLTQLPSTGGDTLWASGYEVYDRISPPLQKFLETLTATYAQPGFGQAAKNNGFELYTSARGSPDNTGSDLEAIHPVVRTNPVTGWKSIFAVGHHVQKINGLSEDESKHFINWFYQLVQENHDLQVRHKWQNENDVAIWDNRSVYHAATPDYVGENLGERKGSRSVSVGEKPYFDPGSVSRQQARKAEAQAALETLRDS
ncbi:alpha-ketoglutarate-dependent sulfonate dioxygenase [Sarocladium strictum]